jgi:hypothetical protein
VSNSIVIPSRQRRQDQRFFIGGSEVYGIQSINVNYNLGATSLEHLGMTNTLEFPTQPQIATVSINSLVLNADVFINYTGNTSINGYIVNSSSSPGSENFSFTNAYLTSYSIKCGIGQIPEVSTEFLVLGNAGYFPDGYSVSTDTDFAAIEAYNSTLNPNIASYSTIDVNLDDFTTNRLQSFQVNINTPRNPIYSLGSRTPYLVDQGQPIEVNASFTIDVNDYLAYRLNSYPCSPVSKNLTLTFKNYQTNSTIISYSFNNMRLQGISRSIDVNSNASLEFKYRTYIEPPTSAIPGFRADCTLVTADTTEFSADYSY